MGNDSSLASDLASSLLESPNSAALHNLQGIGFQIQDPADWGTAAQAFQNSWASDPRQVMAGLNLAEILAFMGQKNHAIEQAQRTLAVLDCLEQLPEEVLDAPHTPPGYDGFRVEWEQAAWKNAGNPKEEASAKRQLLAWRLHRLLGDWTGDLVHYFQSHAARPDLPVGKAALGCALGRANRPADAWPYLQAAYRQNPFDRQSTRAYFHGLGLIGHTGPQHALIEEVQCLAKAAPRLVPAENWFASQPTVPGLPTTSNQLLIVWQGTQKAIHSLGLVNREICARLIELGHELALVPSSIRDAGHPTVVLPEILQNSLARTLSGPADVHISHQWPPDFRKPVQGRWVIMQQWEYGSLPCPWIEPLRNQVDETWVASAFVRDCFIQSGVPADKVQIIPLGVGSEFFQKPLPFPLKTKKKFRFLFVGGTIERKGIDLLLKTYHQVFSNRDDVCLVIKDMGTASFYQGQTAQHQIKLFQQKPNAPEVEYLIDELSPSEMVSLYAACHCLVHPYRGEGFGLPIAEAMASGLPVVVTGLGAALDFCREEHAYLIPARIVRFPTKELDKVETVDFPWWAEPDQDFLRWLLRHVIENQQEAKEKGVKARAFIQNNFTWGHTVAAVEARLETLSRPKISRPVLISSQGKTNSGRPGVSLTMIVKNEEQNLFPCLDSVGGLVDEIVIVDTGSTDATVEMAKSRGAKVFHFPWIDDFAAARNEALLHATGEWIFLMDADDRLDETNRSKLGKLLTELPSGMAGFVMKCLCLPDRKSGTATIVDHIRLFTNHPDLRWKYRIHEQILLGIRRLGGKIHWSDVVIQHTGYQDADVRQKKLERDLRILHLENKENPDDPFTLFNLGSVFMDQKLPAKALEVFQRSLKRSQPTDSIVRKLYSLISQSHRFLGNLKEALSASQEGRKNFPKDPEILFQESVTLQKLGDKEGAIDCLLKIVEEQDGVYFASVDTGLRLQGTS